MTTALVLAGHGSHITPETADLVWRQVDALRALGVADEITAAFWKEQPSFATVLNSLAADDITVVPLFTAQGYFTQTVIPAEMGLTGALTRLGNRTIRYTHTLNEHPYLSNIVRQRVETAIQYINTSPDQIAIAIIGHSTRRNPESRKATEAQAVKIRALNLAAEVQAVYLDDSPGIPDIYTLTHAPNIIAVPYFLTQGSHTTIDVPKALGLSPGAISGIVQNRSVYYTPAVGVEEGLQTAILDLARESGAPLYPPRSSSEWDAFPMQGRDLLIQTVRAEKMLHFGDLRLTPSEVRHWESASSTKIFTTPSALRNHLRTNAFVGTRYIVSAQDTNTDHVSSHFRSLTTARNLPSDWRIHIETPAMLHAVTETIYPGAVADWASHQRGTFHPTPLTTVVARQTGNYRQLSGLNNAQQASIVQNVCSGCVRHPTWFEGTSPPNAIACPEPCNHWLSAALENIE